MDELNVVKTLALGLTSAGVSGWCALLARGDVEQAGVLGRRGLQRVRALRARGLLAALDPAIRWLAHWTAKLPIHAGRLQLERYLQQTGDVWGVTADELLALSAIVTLMTTSGGWLLGSALAAPWVCIVAGVMCGPGWVALSLQGHRQRRFLEVDRGLPAVIDLAALCMGAGLDLPGALQLVVRESASPGGALTQELHGVLRALSLGHTRTQALRSLEQRVPTASVHDFVAAVVQAEEKGTPLSDALQIQAGVLRGRRSVLAEEAAARAGVWMMFPLMLLLACTMLLAMGGMVIRGMESTR